MPPPLVRRKPSSPPSFLIFTATGSLGQTGQVLILNQPVSWQGDAAPAAAGSTDSAG